MMASIILATPYLEVAALCLLGRNLCKCFAKLPRRVWICFNMKRHSLYYLRIIPAAVQTLHKILLDAVIG